MLTGTSFHAVLSELMISITVIFPVFSSRAVTASRLPPFNWYNSVRGPAVIPHTDRQVSIDENCTLPWMENFDLNSCLLPFKRFLEDDLVIRICKPQNSRPKSRNR